MEVVAVRTDKLNDAIPDVFGQTNTTMCFEEATSVSRHPDLCATKVGDWVVVIDVGHRLSGAVDYLEEASASTDLHLARMDDMPDVAIALHYRNGQPVAEAAVPEDEDGESWAMEMLRKKTGVRVFGPGDPMGLWDAEFTLFTLS